MLTDRFTFAQFSSAASRKGTLALCLALCLTAMVFPASGQEPHIIKFDAPNAGAGNGQGTDPLGINFLGTITGNVTDSNYGTHGFVRSPAGQFTNFDIPGADPVVGCTCPDAINDFGVVTGYYIDTNGVSHGFVRTPDGTNTEFDDPGAGSLANQGQGTTPQQINNFGAVTGYYIDANGLSHGFVRTPDGKITNFDEPEAGTGAYQGTTAGSINDFGLIAGYYTDGNYFDHGFLRTPDGKFTSLDAPGAVTSSFGTIVYNLNDLGTVAGYWFDVNYAAHGFLRTLDGHFTSFEAPGAGTGSSNSGYTEGTFVTALNLEGATTGFGIDTNADASSFVRTSNGKVTTFTIPGQILGAGNDYGSIGLAINAEGIVVGRWRDTNYAVHGYIMIPKTN